MSLLEQALIYLDMGWCVYPAHHVDLNSGLCTCGNLDCPCPGKHPIGQWTAYQRRLPTKAEVELWFSELECNIGMVTGTISKVAVVDVDGKEGHASLKDLDLDPTLSALTGGGGIHMYYSISEPTRSRIRVVDGIDIRADGGYVVLPPSLHKSGRWYVWKDVTVLAPFDASLFETEARKGSASPGWSGEALQGVHQGSRSVTAARLAGRYFGLGLDLDEVWMLMTGWNKRNSPPLSTPELDRTVIAIDRKHKAATKDPVQIKTLAQLRTMLEGLGD